MVSKSESSSTLVQQTLNVPTSSTTESTTAATSTTVSTTGNNYNIPTSSSSTTDVLQGSAGQQTTTTISTPSSSVIVSSTANVQISPLSTSIPASQPSAPNAATVAAAAIASSSVVASSSGSGSLPATSSSVSAIVVTSAMSTSDSSALPRTEATSSAQPTDVSHASNSGQNGVHQGTLAGAVVGAALGAALLSALLTIWICLARNRRSDRSRRQKSRSRDRTSTGVGLLGGSGRGLSEKELGEGELLNSAQQWSNILPQSADDTSMRQAVKTLFAQIELHVDNYYVKKVHALHEADIQRLEQLDCKTLPKPISEMLVELDTLLPTIAHAIGSLLLREISVHDGSRATLLPAQLSYFPSRLRDQSLSPGEQSSSTMCYSQYKRLAAYLYPPPENDAGHSQQLERASARIAEIVQSSFAPWQNTAEPEEAARRNCLGLCSATARLGFLIMSQPATYDFKWEQAQLRNDAEDMLVLPSFWRVTDEKGHALRKPLRVVSATRR